MLIGPMNALPWVINGVVEAIVSVKRISRLLLLPRCPIWSHLDSRDLVDPPLLDCTSSTSSILISGMNFYWSDSGTPVLSDISLCVMPGQLVGITGPVGSGKSALLLAILGELRSEQTFNTCDSTIDTTRLRPRYAYMGQTPWLFGGSILENILFGSAYDPVWLDKVLFACALDDDIHKFPSGVDTDVGESGGSRLSGGQRARVVLARAVYQQADVYLLDDPLSALDVHVSEHVIQHCLLGLLAAKTRVITSSHRNSWFVQKHPICNAAPANVILEMKDGRIVKRFSAEVPAGTGNLVDSGSSQEDDLPDADDSPLLGQFTDEHQPASCTEATRSSAPVEQIAVGVIDKRVYAYYFRSVGYCLGIGVILSLVIMQATRNAADWWLAHWVQNTDPSSDQGRVSLSNLTLCEVEPLLLASVINKSVTLKSTISWTNMTPAYQPRGDSFYLYVYGGIVSGHVLASTFRAFLFALSGLAAAAVIHRDAFQTVLQGCGFYFDQTPQGRILNRFSSDVATVDDGLPFILNIFLANVAGLLGVCIVACLALPSLIIILMPLIFVFWSVQLAYRGAARDLKRIASVCRSPVYAHFVDTLSGLAVLRGLVKESRFRQLTVTTLGDQLRADLASLAAGSWLSIRLQLISTVVVAGVVWLALVGKAIGLIEVATAGLSAAYALSIASLMTGTVYVATETEKNFVAVERCQELAERTPVELDTVSIVPTAPSRTRRRDAGLLRISCAVDVPAEWPLAGRVEFCSVSLTYQRIQPSGDAEVIVALNNVSFLLHPGERVGIVGRTGSGKTSIVRVLLRLVDHMPGTFTNLDISTRNNFIGASGKVFVDGIDIRSVPLRVLRSRILMIIQEPFLFSGTVRENLDPSHAMTDDQLSDALLKCQLVSSVVEARGWLEREVGESGREMSAGQRQLICLARALLHHPKPKIICLDEVTAAVDDHSEEIIMDVLNREFRDSTIILIAHRLSVVIRFCSHVLIMHGGQLVNDGHAKDLLCEAPIPDDQLQPKISDLIQM